MPDMAYSRAYETYSENDIFPDKQTNRTPVAGTISRDQLPPFPIAEDAPVILPIMVRQDLFQTLCRHLIPLI